MRDRTIPVVQFAFGHVICATSIVLIHGCAMDNVDMGGGGGACSIRRSVLLLHVRVAPKRKLT